MARKPVNLDVNPLFRGPSLAERTRGGSPYRELALSEIDVDPEQPRRVFEKQGLQELADSIAEYGVINPILVRANETGTYRLVSGERRFRAARLAGLETIPATIEQEELDEPNSLSKQLVENLQRADLTPMERALAIGKLREMHSWSIREIAKKLGVTKALVQRSLEVLALPDDLQAAIIAGASESKVLLLKAIDSKELRAALLARLEGLTRDNLEQEISALSGGPRVYRRGTRKPAKKRSLSAEDQHLINQAQRALGTKVELLRKPSDPSSGKVVIEFYSDDDLKELFHRLDV